MLHHVEGYPQKITSTFNFITNNKIPRFPNISIIFSNAMTIPGLPSKIVKYHDFSRVSMTVGTLSCFGSQWTSTYFVI